MSDNSATQAKAKAFKSLHVPGKPILLPSVYDTSSAHIVINNFPACKALTTDSYGVAFVNGTVPSRLDMDYQLEAIREIGDVAQNKYLTMDLQDGYGGRLEGGIESMIIQGVVGITLDDSDHITGDMMDESFAVNRIKRAIAGATAVGVPDFVINASSDSFRRGGTVDESIRRGKLYLDAGATCVLIAGGGPFGIMVTQLRKIVTELNGKVNIVLGPAEGGLSSLMLTDMGVARISLGSGVYMAAAEATEAAVRRVFG